MPPATDLASLAGGGTVFASGAREKLARLRAELEPLARRYDVVVANPPYMGSGNMNKWLGGWTKDNYAAMLKDAAAAIVVFGDSDKADTWIEDSSIALTYMHLMAAEQKVGSCWVQIHMRRSKDGNDAEENVRKIMNVPDNYRVIGILSLGMPAENCKPHDFEHLDYRTD